MAHIFWLLVAAVMIVLEMISLGLTTIWFAGGAFVAAIIAWAFEAHWIVQILVFAIVSLVLLFFTRPIAKKHLMKSIEKTNVEGLIGTVGCVTATIDNMKAEGTVKLDGKEWWARSVDDSIIEKGELVVVKQISGVKLIVEKKKDAPKSLNE